MTVNMEVGVTHQVSPTACRWREGVLLELKATRSASSASAMSLILRVYVVGGVKEASVATNEALP